MATAYARWSKVSRKGKRKPGRSTRSALEQGQSGRSAVAAAAYAAGVRLSDKRTGRVHDFRAKSGVYASLIVGGGGWQGSQDREALWNMAELAERYVNACTARELTLALPHELTHGQRLELVRKVAQDLADRFGTVVDASLHMPSKEGDQRNFHAHLLMTTRKVNADGTLGEKTRELDAYSGKQLLKAFRLEVLEKRINDALAELGIDERVDMRSYKERGMDKRGQIREGVNATNARRRGLKLYAEHDGEKSFHQQNVEAGRVAAITDLDRLHLVRNQIMANDLELRRLHAQRFTLPRKITRIKAPALLAGRRGSPEQFTWRVGLYLVDLFAGFLSRAQLLALTARVVEDIAHQRQRIAAIRSSSQALRKQQAQLVAKIMKEKKDGGGQGAAGTHTKQRLRRRRVYAETPPVVEAHIARANQVRRRPQQKPPHVYAQQPAGRVNKRTRPQKARYDRMRSHRAQPNTPDIPGRK